MLASGAIDVQQADLTRCGGVRGFLRAATLCEAHHTDLSGHGAPAIHLHAACAPPQLRHLEWFHDHMRIEAMLFEGAPQAKDGLIQPDLTRPGHGIAFRTADAYTLQRLGSGMILCWVSHRAAASPLLSGLELKAIGDRGAPCRTASMTCSNSATCLAVMRTPAPITIQS